MKDISMTRFAMLISTVFLVFATGCIVGERGSGISKTENREVDDFHAVSISGSGNLHVTVGEQKSVTVTVDDNLIDMVRTEVKDGQLLVYTDGSYSTSLGLNIEVGVPALDSASVSGAGDIKIDNASGPSLNMSISGAGDIIANGDVEKIEVAVSGAGEAQLKELKAKDASVSVSGAGDAVVFVTGSVEARASGAGDIDIYGNPTKVKDTVSGVGDVTVRK